MTARAPGTRTDEPHRDPANPAEAMKFVRGEAEPRSEIGRRGISKEPSLELVSRVEPTDGLQPWRRLFHAANGLAMALLPGALGLDKAAVLLILGFLFVVALMADIARLRDPRLNALFFRAFGSLASAREAVGIASSTWFLAGVFLTWALFPARVAVAGILVLALADPAAGTVGRLWGKRRLGKGTVAGSSTFLLVAFAVLAAHLGPTAGLVGALAAAAVEAVSGRIDDNLTVPVTAAFSGWLVWS